MKLAAWLLAVWGIGLVITPGALAQASCDPRKEILDVLTALDRYAGYATEAVTLRRVPQSDAVKAGIDFRAQRDRAHYVCGPQFTAEGSKERRLMDLVFRHAVAFDLLLLGSDSPNVKAGQEAGLELVSVAHNYFTGTPLKKK
jgi:hypothetical protein